MTRYDRLLVPVDGSEASYTATRHALGLADATGAAVDVVHVVEVGGSAVTLGGEELARVLRNRGRALLSTAEGLADGTGLEVTAEIVEGRPYESILEYASARGTHLVVMGRHGAGSVGERLMGGVTEKVLRAGRLPVLTAWGDDRDDVDDAGVVAADRLLLPTDGSDCAELAAEHAATLADVAGATVHVVSVADVEAAGGLFDAGGLSEEFVENVEARCAEAVDGLARDVEGATGRPVETAVVRGSPSEALRDYVEEEDIDVVAMGAHGRSGVSRWVLGSVAERLLRSVAVPILVVPGGQ